MRALRPARVTAFAVALLTSLALLAAGSQLGNTFDDLVREPAIGYFTTPPADPVARLKQRVESGEPSS